MTSWLKRRPRDHVSGITRLSFFTVTCIDQNR